MSSSNDFSDPKQGGSLADMAPTGTTMPNDAGEMNLIPSVPRPGQAEDDGVGAASLDRAADNANDIPRGVGDKATAGDVMTGTGDTLPSTVDGKRLHDGPGGKPNDPASKGHPRDERVHKQKAADAERAAEDPEGTADPEE